MISFWTAITKSRLPLVPCSWNSLFYIGLQRTLMNLLLCVYITLNLPWSLLRYFLWPVCMIFQFTSSLNHFLCMGSLAQSLNYLGVFAITSCQAFVLSDDVICTKLCLNTVISSSMDVFIRVQLPWCFAKHMYDLMIWRSTEFMGKRRDIFFVFEISPTGFWVICNSMLLSVIGIPWRILFKPLRDGLLSVCMTWSFQFELQFRNQDSL